MSITIIYYTANVVSDVFAENIRNHLKDHGLPIVSVSHKPINLGKNIVINKKKGFTPKPSAYNVYKQILIGAKRARTKYIACCEDDSLYVKEHFETRPPDDVFYYNLNRWSVNQHFFFYRRRFGMFACISDRKLMIQTLKTRFRKYDVPVPRTKGAPKIAEPGRYERKLGLPLVKKAGFKTQKPILTFNHRSGMASARKPLRSDVIQQCVDPWGKAYDVWNKFWGKV